MGSSGREVINIRVNHSHVRRAASRAATAGEGVSAGPVRQAASEAAAAIPGGETAAAFAELGDVLGSRLAAFRTAVTGWSDDVQAAVALYEATDATAEARLARLQRRAV